MASILEAIPKAIADGFRGKLLKGTLIKVNTTGRDPTNGDPVTTTASYPVQGFRDVYSQFYRAQAGIPDEDVRITLIAGLCGAEPAIGDKVTIAGGTWEVRKIGGVDPAGATFDLQCFAVKA